MILDIFQIKGRKTTLLFVTVELRHYYHFPLHLPRFLKRKHDFLFLVVCMETATRSNEITYCAWTRIEFVSSRPDHFFFWIFDIFGSTISRAPRMHLRYEKSSTVPSVRTTWKQRLSVNLGCHPTCDGEQEQTSLYTLTSKRSMIDAVSPHYYYFKATT